MNDNVAIKVEHVSKKFCRYLRKSMLYGMHDIGRNLFRMSTKPDRLRKHEFWAVNDVSFELHRGETLGIIGPNGSGKSTILKMLNGIFMPDKGKIEINGRMGALIEIGAGFHPLLTGRENIYVNGAILGMSKKEIDEKFEDIVEFADIGDFLDTPVRNYSSGMYVRLGFSVAVHTKPDILIVDEVLSVGDRSFQQKSVQRMRELITEGDKSVIFVSHNLSAVRSLCKHAIWLNNGKIHAEGTTDHVASQYEQFVDNILRNESAEKLTALDPGFQGGLVKFTDVQILNEEGEPTQAVEFMNYLRIRAWYETEERIDRPNFRFHIFGPDDTPIATPSSLYQGNLIDCIEPGTGYVDCITERLPLMPGNYSVHVTLTSADFLVFHTRTPHNVNLYVSHPGGKRRDVPTHLINDCQVWIPCQIEYGK